MRYASFARAIVLREQIAIKDGCGENFIEVFGTKHKHGFMLHNRSSVGVAGRKESRENHWIRQLFLDLILTQGRKFEDIKTNVTRHVLGTEPTRKCLELPQYNEGKNR